MSDGQFISDEDLEQVDGGKAMARRKLEADMPIDAALGQGELPDDELSEFSGGKAIDPRRMDPASDVEIAQPGHQDDDVARPPTPL